MCSDVLWLLTFLWESSQNFPCIALEHESFLISVNASCINGAAFTLYFDKLAPGASWSCHVCIAVHLIKIFRFFPPLLLLLLLLPYFQHSFHGNVIKVQRDATPNQCFSRNKFSSQSISGCSDFISCVFRNSYTPSPIPADPDDYVPFLTPPPPLPPHTHLPTQPPFNMAAIFPQATPHLIRIFRFPFSSVQWTQTYAHLSSFVSFSGNGF